MKDIDKDFFCFLKASPTPWHTIQEISSRLEEEDYVLLDESERWTLKHGGHYFLKRGGSLIAFSIPQKAPLQALICASHTDSPCLKIKPNAQFRSHNMNLFRVEQYGGPLLSTWFDRDLALAGQVYVKDKKQIKEHLLFAENHPLIIPSLAIHLQEKKEGVPIQYLDKQEHLCPLIGLSDKEQDCLEKIIKSYIPYQNLLGFDLYLVPTQAPTLLGSSKEFIGAYRLDNLCSAHATLTGLLHAKSSKHPTLRMAVFWNHEEIGSHSNEGAASPLLEETLKRICLALNYSEEDFFRLKHQSLCLSLDVAHCFHPNFGKRYDPQDHPLFHQGIMIKYNANLLYATSALSTALVVDLCQEHKIPYQLAASHSEIRGGTTVGPITAAGLGITTIDIGIPLLAMHSTRELTSVEDHKTLCRFTKTAFETLFVQ